MRASQTRWLLGELPGLIERGVIDAPVADRLRSHYEAAGDRKPGNVLVAIFGVLGAILVAAGILLVLAHNWDDLSVALRTGLAFAPLLVAQAIAVWVRLRRFRSTAWREGAASFLALSAGSCLALLGQIYQLPLSLAGLILAWSVLALPLVFLFRSRVTETLYWIGITSWLFSGPTELVSPGRLIGFGLLAGLAAALSWATARDGTARFSLPAWVISLCLVAAAFRATWGSPLGVWLVVCAGLFGALHGISSLLADGGRTWRAPLRWVGSAGIAIGVIVLSYREVWEELGDALFFTYGSDGFTMFGVGLGLVAAAAIAGVRLLRARRAYESAAALAIVPVVPGLALESFSNGPTAAMLIMNLFGIGLGLLACREGLRRRHLASANFGLLLMSAVLVARFFDMEWSFLLRGVVFVVLGACFLALNLRMAARRREVTA